MQGQAYQLRPGITRPELTANEPARSRFGDHFHFWTYVGEVGSWRWLRPGYPRAELSCLALHGHSYGSGTATTFSSLRLALLTRRLFASDCLSYAHGRGVSRRADPLKLRLFVQTKTPEYDSVFRKPSKSENFAHSQKYFARAYIRVPVTFRNSGTKMKKIGK